MPPRKRGQVRDGQWNPGSTPQAVGPNRNAGPSFHHFGDGPSVQQYDDYGRPIGASGPQPGTSYVAGAGGPPAEQFRDEEDGLVQGDTFAEYMPAKLNIGVRHPDHIVETTSLRSVPPPDVKYELKLPAQLIDKGLLSALQLESVVYSCQQHETFLGDGKRAGFLVGDGAGVGKGRTIAGIIYENFLRGRKKAIWISISADLKVDALRDLKDIGVDCIPVHRIEKLSYAPIGIRCGVLFGTYSALISQTKTKKPGCFSSRLQQLLDWCGKSYDGVIVFDESHKAKNLYPSANLASTKTGVAVHDLQAKLPGARVVYASATGATEPRNMGYMSRLGLWGEMTQFDTFSDFHASIDKRGVGAMELVAMEMKHRGMYIARQLSFQGVSFQIAEVPLTPEFIRLYDQCVDFWIHADKAFREASALAKLGKKRTFVTLTQFWNSHQRFFKYLCLSAKIEAAVNYAKEAVANGNCAVIGLQSTGEAKTDQMREEMERVGGELTEFISTSRAVFMSLLNLFPLDIDVEGKKNNKFVAGDDEDTDEDSEAEMDRLQEEMDLLEEHGLDRNIARTERQGIKKLLREKKEDLMTRFDLFADKLPPNTLDTLLDMLGGPSKVAEMTGRKGRMIADENGAIRYEQRKLIDDVDSLNIAEKEAFMRGDKLIAVISEAASSGISLQADRRVQNQRRRVHITLELAWSADRAIQQFGRTHRSNQASAPEYVFLISEVAGEKRFASVVARRLERLGALTHGDRRVTETRDLSMFNVDTKYGKKALRDIMSVFLRDALPAVAFPTDYRGNFVLDAREGLAAAGIIVLQRKADGNDTFKLPNGFGMDRFMNRILGMRIKMQNAIFQFFIDTLDHVIAQAQKEGKFDVGTMELGKPDAEAKLIKRVYFKQNDKEHSKSYISTVQTERGLSFAEASILLKKNCTDDELTADNGFYRIRNNIGIRPFIMLAVRASGNNAFSRNKTVFDLYRPNTGRQLVSWFFEELREKYVKIVDLDQARRLWASMYDMTATDCAHKYLHGNCRVMECTYGMHRRTDYILNGSVLGIWREMETMFEDRGSSGEALKRMQIVRILFKACRVIGVQLPFRSYPIIMEALRKSLGREIEDTDQALAAMAKEEEHQKKQEATFQAKPARLSLATPLAGSMMSSAAKKNFFVREPSTSTSKPAKKIISLSSSESGAEVEMSDSSSASSVPPSPVMKKRDVKPNIKPSITIGNRKDPILFGGKPKLSHANSPSASKNSRHFAEVTLITSDEEEDCKPVVIQRKKKPAVAVIETITLVTSDDEDDLPPVRAKVEPKKKVLRLLSSSEEDEVKPVAVVQSEGFVKSEEDQSPNTSWNAGANTPLKLKTKSGFGGGMYKAKPQPVLMLLADSEDDGPAKLTKKEPSSSEFSSPLRTLNKENGPKISKIVLDSDMEVDDESVEESVFAGTRKNHQPDTDAITRGVKRLLSSDSIDL